MQDVGPVSGRGGIDSTRSAPIAGPDPRTSHERSALISALAVGGFALEPRLADLGAVVQQVAIDYAPNAIAVGSELRVKLALVVGQWDPQRLRDIAVELIYNAIGHADGKPIDISVAAIDERAQLVVQDHGRGVPAHARESLFEPALRSSAAPFRFCNGLWLARTLATAMAGTVELEPSDAGARFVVMMPRMLAR